MTKIKRRNALFTIVALLIAAILLTLVSGCKKQTCTVTFKAVGEEDIVITTKYGKSITPPQVPEKIGNDGKWDVAYFGKITENFTVNAVYETRGLEYTPLDNGTGLEVSKGEMDENTQELFIPEKYNGARVIRIANSAFEECDNLKRAVLPDSVLYIGEKAFYLASVLEEFDAPAALIEIERSAFGLCRSLKEVSFSENLIIIGANAFSSCRELMSLVFPSNLNLIEEGAFNFCITLKTVVFTGESLATIGERAFSMCGMLKTVEFPPFSVSEIGEAAFSYCSDLYSITLPASISKIGGFEDWGQEKTIYVKGHKEQPIDWQNGWCGEATVVWNA